MPTAIGPQSPNYTTSRPTTAPNVSGNTDTWFKDCTAPGANDGTILDASFLNVVIAQMREAIRSASVTLDDADNLMLWKAMQAAANARFALLTASRGVIRIGDDIRLAVGGGTLPVLTY